MALGLLIILAGGLVSPLPGPAGLPLVLVGLVVILRSSYKAKRLFVRLQRAHPRLLSPLRRLLGRDPKVVAVLWQQSLRVEKLVVPRRWRFAVRVRRRFFHKR